MTRFALNPFTKQLDIVDVGSAAGPIDTLSGENGPSTPPSGSNFNFSGSTSGGASANGAILFSTPSSGQMNAAVQVDGTTIQINASNQLTALSSDIIWAVQSADLTAVSGRGYFANSANPAPTGLDVILPAVCAVGDRVAIQNFNGNGFVVTPNTGQQIYIGTRTSTLATGSLISLTLGDTVYLTCAVANTIWSATAWNGDFLVT